MKNEECNVPMNLSEKEKIEYRLTVKQSLDRDYIRNKPIPTLTGKEAEEFIRKAEEVVNAPKIDFSKEIEVTNKILKKYEQARNK
jgi:hypothetical protein